MFCTFLYVLFCGYSALFVFLYAFFPVTYKSDNVSSTIPEGIVMHDDYFVKLDSMHEFNTVDNIALIIIDALRYDFISEKYFNSLPYLSSLNEKSNNACVFSCRVSVPTVTMPRVKSIATGTVSSFVDVLLNFGNNTVKQDNWLRQAKNNNKTIVFYGDSTWLNLFPDVFSRSEGTHSFFVLDYKEVDNNVTRNVFREIENYDWQMLILHYLGLDHIGHVEGPNSSKIPLKLAEMDSVVRSVHDYLMRREQLTKQKYLLLIGGDHGMKDTGGHGGSSFAEVVTPLITIGVPCRSGESILQTDIAPTISFLWGIPIPYGNVGKLIEGIVDYLPKSQQLFGYYYNIYQIMQSSSNLITGREVTIFNELVDLHRKFIVERIDNFDAVINGYKLLLTDISDRLLNSFIKFDIFLLWTSFILMMQTTIFSVAYKQLNVPRILWIILNCANLFCVINILTSTFYDRTVGGFSSVFLTVILYCIISFNSVLLLSVSRKSDYKIVALNGDVLDAFLSFGTLLQIISTLSSSFVEEEHLIWFYLWNTLFFLLLMPLTSNKRRYLLRWAFVAGVQRFLMQLNHHGVQWAFEPAFSDWLQSKENIAYLSVFTVAELILVFFASDYIDSVDYFEFPTTIYVMDKLCLITTISLIYLYRCSVGDVYFVSSPFELPYGQTEFALYKYSLFIYAAIKCCRIRMRYLSGNHGDGGTIKIEIVKALTIHWLIWCSILMKPFNVILLSFLCFSSILACKLIKHAVNLPYKYVLIHYWLAYVFFYYQGNSNNLATIDVTTGYIGQSDYDITVASTFIFCSTYSTCILALLLLTLHLLTFCRRKNSHHSNYLLFFNSLHVTFYMLVIIMQKEHLFIWSVFTPKLIYLAAFSLTIIYPYCVLLFVVLN